MATYSEARSLASEAKPVGLLTEGAGGLAVIVIAVLGLAGFSAENLGSIATIVVGVGLMVQAFNAAAEHWKATDAAARARGAEVGGEVMVDCMCGLAGIILGILALVGINPAHLVSSALIVFGGALLVNGAIAVRARVPPAGSAGDAQADAYDGSAAASGMESLIGLAVIVLGILSLLTSHTWVLLLVGLIAVGAALLLASASFSSSVVRLFAVE
jgi:hypothetical protein